MLLLSNAAHFAASERSNDWLRLMACRLLPESVGQAVRAQQCLSDRLLSLHEGRHIHAGENGAFIVYQPFLQAIQEQMRHVGGAYVSTEPKTVLQPVSTPHAAASMQHKAPVAPANSAREVRPATTLSGMPAAHLSIADREPYPYFEQQEHLPHNRRECDTFNRFHFGRLRASRGDGALTPKVGQEPLTRYEAEYAKQVHRNRSPSPAQVRHDAFDIVCMCGSRHLLSYCFWCNK